MNIFIYIMIFIMGTFFGSFFSLAVYRIPLGKDITHEHSFCPNCNHKLGVLDLIPVWSYIFLKGKCRYCGEKVRIRYLLLEVLSGLVFLFTFCSLNVENIYYDYAKIVDFVFFVCLYITMALTAGIDKENKNINFSVISFGAVCQIIYILYLYIIGDTSMYRYSIYFAIFIFVFIIGAIIQKKKESYVAQICVLVAYIFSVVGPEKTMINMLLTLCLMLVLKIFYKKKYEKFTQMPVGFLLGISTIITKIVENFTTNF